MVLYRAIYYSGLKGNYNFYMGAVNVFEMGNIYKQTLDPTGYWVLYANQNMTDSEVLSILQSDSRTSTYLV